MTVTYLKDGRIEVKDPHDALLLSLAGIILTDGRHVYAFARGKWHVDGNIIHSTFGLPLYVRADVARGFVVCISSDSDPEDRNLQRIYWYNARSDDPVKEGDIVRFVTEHIERYKVSMRLHNDRWNLLPEIEMEK